MIAFPEKYKPLALSLLFHLLILAVMAFYAIPQMLNPKWYEISFGEFTRETLPLPEDYTVQPNLGESAQVVHAPVLENTAKEMPPTRINEESQAPAHPGTSEILETPIPSNTAAPARIYTPGNNPLAKAALRGMITGASSGTGDGSVGISVQGGKVHFSLPTGYKHNLGTGGSVTLRFQVDKYARPIPGTIISDQQTEGRLIEAAKKVLLDGTLSFLGEPNPGVTCIITIEFL